MSYWNGKQFNVKRGTCGGKPNSAPPAPKPKMSDKELVEKALDVIAPKDMENVGGLYDFAERIVNADWLPPHEIENKKTEWLNNLANEIDSNGDSYAAKVVRGYINKGLSND